LQGIGENSSVRRLLSKLELSVFKCFKVDDDFSVCGMQRVLFCYDPVIDLSSDFLMQLLLTLYSWNIDESLVWKS
jgi:hypothetical protein